MRTGRTSTGRFLLWGLLGTLATFWAASCQGPEEFFRENMTASGSGGASGTGGTLTGAGGSGTGGLTATGGAPATGGVPGTGGIVATGGVKGTGGIVATGGVPGTGGRATGGVPGTGGIVATGGVPGTGGRSTGGVTGTGGIVATGGVPGTGGSAVGGTSGMAGSTGTAKNCADAIKLAGYSAGTAPPCSACKENGADKSTNCMKVVDCLDANYPCGSNMNCALQCNNSGGADSIVSACVNALLTAASCVQP
jgi:hypothetical protein